MRKVLYHYREMRGARSVGWLTATGWFHKFVVVREGRQDEVQALIETKTGEVVSVSLDNVKFHQNPLTSDE